MEDPNPRPGPPARTELAQWMRSECVIEHAGTEISYRLEVAADGRSFTLGFLDCQTNTVEVAGEDQVEYVFPSVEGTVVMCQLISGRTRYYDVRDGRELKEEELRQINPHFYN